MPPYYILSQGHNIPIICFSFYWHGFCSFPNLAHPFYFDQFFFLNISYFLCMHLSFYRSRHFPSWNLNSKRMCVLNFDLCSTQHSRPHLINVLGKEKAVKLEADLVNNNGRLLMPLRWWMMLCCLEQRMNKPSRFFSSGPKEVCQIISLYIWLRIPGRWDVEAGSIFWEDKSLCLLYVVPWRIHDWSKSIH